MQVPTTDTIQGYEIQEEIGAGGFGIVYRAVEQSVLRREVAIKVVLPKYANQPDYIRRFESEAQIVSRLEHPHIVPLYDYWRNPDGAYLVMRWLRGGNLKAMIAQEPLNLETTGHILNQVGTALALAHRQGVIHRDIKPSNVLLDEEGNAYLTDFGIAKDLAAFATQTEPDVVMGTSGYMSPEQARSETVSPRTDVYSLGVMLYEMLAGEHPFPNVNRIEQIYKHLNDPLPLLTGLENGVQDGINDVIQKATAKNPAERYGDVLKFVAAYREAAQLGGIAAENIFLALTRREQEILQLIVEGKLNKEIAQKLYITVGTVRWHIRQIYKKLNVRSRVQAIVKARELNLIVPASSGEMVRVKPDTTHTYITLPEPENPYKGLQAFQAADSKDFFGREKLTQKLLTRLQEDDQYKRFLAVIGPSGSGKSSLVKAGLIPAIWRGELPDSDNWYVVDAIPGTHPLDELEVALTRVAADQSHNLNEHLRRDARGLVRIGQLILPDDGSELLIVIDQFEELFTLVEDEDIRAHYLDLIYTASTDPRSRVRVVVTLRADFYDRPLQYPDFGELLRNRMETILPLTAEELERTITKPARQVGVKYADGVVSAIIGDVNYQPGALPLLQYALTELFDQRDNHLITREAYQAIGGTVGALARRADDIYGEFTDDGQAAIRQMFLRLVTLGEGTEDTRRRVARSELLAIADDEDLMDEIIDAYAGYRLLSLDHDPATRSPTVEVAHEAILREWERLRGWLHESREDIRLQRQLAAMTAEWLDAGRDASYLRRGSSLRQFEGWAVDTELALTADERAFLEDSVNERERQAQRERERQAHEHRLQSRFQRAMQMLAGVSLLAAVVGIGLALFAFGERNRAEDARVEAERESDVNRSLMLANQAVLLENGDSSLALGLSLEAVKIDDPPPQAVSALRRVSRGLGSRALIDAHANAVRALEISSDGFMALSGSCATLDASQTCIEGELILWDLTTKQEVRRFVGHTSWVNDVVFLPDGESLVSAGGDGVLIRWDMHTGTLLQQYSEHVGSVNSVAVLPDGGMMLSAGEDGRIIIWDIGAGAISWEFRPDDPETSDIEGHSGSVHFVVVSPDGQMFLSGSDDMTMLLWRLETGDVVQRFVGHNAAVISAVFDGDNRIISAGRDATIRRWDMNGNQLVVEVLIAPTTNVEISNEYILISHVDSIQLRAATNLVFYASSEQLPPHGVQTTLSCISVSQDGRLVLTGSLEGTLIVWNMPQTDEVYRFPIEEVSPGRAIAYGYFRDRQLCVNNDCPSLPFYVWRQYQR